MPDTPDTDTPDTDTESAEPGHVVADVGVYADGADPAAVARQLDRMARQVGGLGHDHPTVMPAHVFTALRHLHSGLLDLAAGVRDHHMDTEPDPEPPAAEPPRVLRAVTDTTPSPSPRRTSAATDTASRTLALGAAMSMARHDGERWGSIEVIEFADYIDTGAHPPLTPPGEAP